MGYHTNQVVDVRGGRRQVLSGWNKPKTAVTRLRITRLNEVVRTSFLLRGIHKDPRGASNIHLVYTTWYVGLIKYSKYYETHSYQTITSLDAPFKLWQDVAAAHRRACWITGGAGQPGKLCSLLEQKHM